MGRAHKSTQVRGNNNHVINQVEDSAIGDKINYGIVKTIQSLTKQLEQKERHYEQLRESCERLLRESENIIKTQREEIARLEKQNKELAWEIGEVRQKLIQAIEDKDEVQESFRGMREAYSEIKAEIYGRAKDVSKNIVPALASLFIALELVHWHIH